MTASSKIFPALLFAMLLAMASCGSDGKKAADSDTVPAADSVPATAQLASDLAWKSLAGNVESCELTSYYKEAPDYVTTETVRFLSNGYISSIKVSTLSEGKNHTNSLVEFACDVDGVPELKAADKVAKPAMEATVTRDDLGRIISYSYLDAETGDFTDGAYTEEYKWDEDAESDRLVSRRLQGLESTSITRFSYDADGRLTKAVTTSEEPGFKSTATTTYRYISFDAQGNWTEREARTDDIVNDEGQEERTTYVAVEKRAITYYPAPGKKR